MYIYTYAGTQFPDVISVVIAFRNLMVTHDNMYTIRVRDRGCSRVATPGPCARRTNINYNACDGAKTFSFRIIAWWIKQYTTDLRLIIISLFTALRYSYVRMPYTTRADVYYVLSTAARIDNLLNNGWTRSLLTRKTERSRRFYLVYDVQRKRCRRSFILNPSTVEGK